MKFRTEKSLKELNYLRRIWIQVKVGFLAFLLILVCIGTLMLGFLGPWMIDIDYFPPHLTWDGEQPMSRSITINLKTPSARLAVEYWPTRYLNGTEMFIVPAHNYINETEEKEYHFITLKNLLPNTEYSYRIIELSNNLNSRIRNDLQKIYTFRTAPLWATGEEMEEGHSFRFAVIGDNRPNFLGTGQVDRINKALLKEENLSFVINTGDLVLMGGGPASWWRQYFIQNAYMRNYITLPTKGNHENFGIEADPYNSTPFELNHAFPHHQNWYSFNYSYVHFICLEVTNYREGAMGDDRNLFMKEWLREDLSHINESSEIKAVIVYMHYPLDTQYEGNGINWDTWEYIAGEEFRLAGVIPDLFLTGHVHDYERMWVNLGDLNGDGEDDYTWNIVCGGGGAELAPARWGPIRENCYRVEVAHHYCIVEANNTALTVLAKYTDGAIFDRLVLNITQ